MTAAVTDIFRAVNAQLLLNDFSVSNWYALIGDELPYTEEAFGPGASDSNVPQAYSYVNATYDLWRNAYGAKKVTSSDVKACIRNIPWVSGTVYDQYDAYDTSFGLRDFYVVTDELKVYKCLSNFGGAASTTKPTATTANLPIITADNYHWKYMYTVTAPDAARFVTLGFIPIETVASNNLPSGSIESFRITNGGTNYPPNTTVNVTVTGDGTTVTANAYVNGSGVITHIEPTVSGQDWTFATVSIPAPDTLVGGSAGTTATALANISPVGGHGSNNINELYAKYAMVQVQFIYDESGNISTVNDFRQIALVRNPTLYGSSSPATDLSYRQSYKLDLTSTSGTFAADDFVTNEDGTHTGYVVEVAGSSIYVNMVRGIFTTEIVQKTDSSAVGTVAAITNPGLQPYSGNLFYYENRGNISRSPSQVEAPVIIFEY